MTVPAAAKVLNVGVSTVYEQIRNGVIPALKLGRRVLVLRVPLERKLRQTPDQSAA
jgi:excisionase family DNA binding protein